MEKLQRTRGKKVSEAIETGYLYHELFAWHDTGTDAGMFPTDPSAGLQPYVNYENADTKRRIHELIVVSGLIEDLQRIEIVDAPREDLLLIHPAEYLDKLKQISDQPKGGDAGDGETPLAKGGFEIAAKGVGAVSTLMKSVIAGQVRNGYALVRPPGHHAVRAGGMGYCLLSNLGVAIAVAKRENPGIRIAVVDWDVHHGNGTQDIFWDDVDVLTISLHQDRLYPRTSGMREEMGVDGSNVNIPLPAGTGNGGYLYAFDQVVIPALMRFKPDLIAVASGFDSSVYDPLGRMMVTASGYAKMTAKLQEVADVYSKGRIVIAHEGGYNAVYSPFCGLFVLQQLSGIKKLDDPFIHTENYPGQDLYPHQAEVIDLAAAQHGLRRG